MLERYRLLFCIKRILRTDDNFRVDVLSAKKLRRIFPIVPPNLGKCCNETLNILRTVADGNIGEKVCHITKLRLNAVFITKNIVDLYPCKTDGTCKNRKLCDIKVVNGIAIDQFFTVSIIAANGIDFVTCVFNKLDNFSYYLLSVKRKTFSAAVKTCHQEVGCARCLCKIDDLMYIAYLNIPADEKNRALR